MSTKVLVADRTAQSETTKLVKKPKAKASLPVVPAEPVVAPEPVVDTPSVDDTYVEEAPKKRLTVAKGSVTVVTAKPAARKTTPRKSPAKKPAAKSPVRSPRSPAAKQSKVTAKAAKPTAKGTKATAKVTKPRRPHNTKPAPIDFSGIGIGPAKVKKVLMHVAFNPVEFRVRQELIAAENKPVRPKPTTDNPDPEMPEQGPQVPVDKLPRHTLDIIRAAERAHEQELMSEFEHTKVRSMSDSDRKAYQEARKKAQESDNFNLRTFNLSQNKKFYADFETWRNGTTVTDDGKQKANDSYALGRTVVNKKGVEGDRFNQWSRAMALVNKVCLRLSNGVRDILACYLDNLVVQYARNGITNCVAEEHSNLQLRHALNPSDGFDDRVPMDAFARTLDGYQSAVNWIESCRQTREELRELRKKVKKGEVEGDSVVATLPDYPDPEYDENFEGYVVEICRSVRMQMANEQKTAAEKAKYHNIKVSENFKKFCSIIIYESILRIGSHLKEVVQLKDVKTVNESLMYHTLRQVSNICGIPFEPVDQDMRARIEKFRTWCTERREARRDKRRDAAKADEESDEDDDLDNVAADADEEEEVVADEELEEEVADDEDADEDGEEVAVEYEEE